MRLDWPGGGGGGGGGVGASILFGIGLAAGADALAGARSLGGGLTPELLNDLIQEKPDNVGTALKRYLETGAS